MKRTRVCVGSSKEGTVLCPRVRDDAGQLFVVAETQGLDGAGGRAVPVPVANARVLRYNLQALADGVPDQGGSLALDSAPPSMGAEM